MKTNNVKLYPIPLSFLFRYSINPSPPTFPIQHHKLKMPHKRKESIWKKELFLDAIAHSIIKLNPILMLHNPVMLIVELSAIITTIIVLMDLYLGKPFTFNLQIALWLWITVVFSNFAASLAEGKGRAQANFLKKLKSEITAKLIQKDGSTQTVAALTLNKGDVVIVNENGIIPSDGEILEGTALVDESPITGESAPVIRESGGDRSAVTGGTKVLSGTLKILISTPPGETFLDHMLKMIQGAKRKKTPNEITLEILLIGLTILFIVVVTTLSLFAEYMHVTIALPVLIALLVCLMPTTIGGLLPAIGIAGMDRLMGKNVIALNGSAVEAAGDVNIVLLDKTGTITLGNRLATEFIPAEGVSIDELAKASLLASFADETPEGRSIVLLAKEKLNLRGKDIPTPPHAHFIKFDVETRMSGIDYDGEKIRKGSEDTIEDFLKSQNTPLPQNIKTIVARIASMGATPLVVAENGKALGVICLKDVLKNGIKEKLKKLHLLGIQTIMITGDNPLTAASIAAAAGVSNFVAQAKPEVKLEIIRKYQNEGYRVAMIGDGTNDAPALAQADVAVAMNCGTQVAREAANMVDLDSSPTKLLDIVAIGKQILITRGSVTTFSIANDLAKYFAIIPAIFILQYPMINIINIMHLKTPQSAILSAVIFNAIIIPFLIPLALKGINKTSYSLKSLLKRNLFVYGLLGIILPFIGIKIIDKLITTLNFI